MTPDQLRSITAHTSPPLVPEIMLAGLPHHHTFETFRTQHQAVIGVATPYWLVAWPGGQGLARYLLDTPKLASRRRVVDLGCGNGLVAIAAAMAGAPSVLAVDVDANALVCAEENAGLNRVDIEIEQADLRDFTPSRGDLICAGDLWYDQATGRQATGCLARLRDGECAALYCDAGRSYRPRSGVTCLKTYDLSASPEFESAARLSIRICTLDAANIHSMHAGHVPQV
ncbi:50S ribosomal protein L11 methyltransferase [Anderseniella sp. Alg231-50]|uniref:50S ribosomal protein L11 methyltransferase n=1 Tax=Anderseniella sp. Alg231-50 TaxID=1922226 RepID=UPI000D56277D